MNEEDRIVQSWEGWDLYESEFGVGYIALVYRNTELGVWLVIQDVGAEEAIVTLFYTDESANAMSVEMQTFRFLSVIDTYIDIDCDTISEEIEGDTKDVYSFI